MHCRIQTSSCSSCSRMACRKALRSWLEDFWSNMPAWMTFWSTLSLYLAAARIFSSTLFTVHRRSTRTSFCCPIRWARSWACRSYQREERKRCSETQNHLKANLSTPQVHFHFFFPNILQVWDHKCGITGITLYKMLSVRVFYSIVLYFKEHFLRCLL